MSPTYDPSVHEDAREENALRAKEFMRLCGRDEEGEKRDYRKDSMGDESNHRDNEEEADDNN